MSDLITKGDLVICYWYDTIDNPAWTKISLIEIDTPPLAKSVGWFLSEDEDCVRILTSVARDDEASSIIFPKGMIKKIEKVQEDELDVE